jgi:hypothetical protein
MEKSKMNLRQKLDFITLCTVIGPEFLQVKSTEEVMQILEDIKTQQIEERNAMIQQTEDFMSLVDEFQRRMVNES